MKLTKEDVFYFLKLPYTPYWVSELIYLIGSFLFLHSLGKINERLIQSFDIRRINYFMAKNILAYENNVSHSYLFWGGFFILLSISIPVVSFIFNRYSYQPQEVKMIVNLLIVLIVAINLWMIFVILKTLWSPILLALLIVFGVSGIIAIAMTSSS